MRVKSLGLIMAIGTLILFTSVAYALFDWSGTSIDSGYAVTTDKHGMEVLLGTPVTAWAGTTNMSIVEVKFRWLYPNGSEFTVVSVSWGDLDHTSLESWNGQDVREFNNTQIPNVIGDWGVQAVFYGPDGSGGKGKGPIPDQPYKVAIRARSFFAVPEVAIGTIAVVVAMFGALSLFALKRKHVSIKKHL